VADLAHHPAASKGEFVMKRTLILLAALAWATSALAAAELGITPLTLDLGYVPRNASSIGKVVIVNAGDEDALLDIHVIIEDGSLASPYGVMRGGGLVTLPPGGRHVAWITVTNMASIGTGHLFIASDAPVVTLRATFGGYSSCAITTNPVDFDLLHQGEIRSFQLAVGNNGAEYLILDPYSTDPNFRITPDHLPIPPGMSLNVTVSFDPQEVGIHSGSIVLGPDVCSTLTVRGECLGVGPQSQDLVGIWWDQALTVGVTEDVAAGQPFHAWLAMLNPSEQAGVGGWELKLDLDGATNLTDVQLEGLSYNILAAPSFCVGLAQPLPWAEQVVLAQFDLMTLDNEWHEIRLVPIERESIPDRMVWAYGDDYALKPMYPTTGGPVVAWYHATTSVPNVAPMPTVALDGRRVEMRWTLPAADGEGCHVYRAVGGVETRLTETPLAPVAGSYVFVDEPAGLPAGAKASYSYAVVKGGIEIARSPVAEIELPAAGPTRLVDNRPNPFNPETAIRFEMGLAGPVRVAVYDVSGRRVAVLLDEVRAAGPHQVIWRGRDDDGRALPSGAYYVRLETASQVDTRKMMLLK